MPTETAPINTVQLSRPRVLVVDDEYGPRESIAFTLGTEFEVDKADVWQGQASAEMVHDLANPLTVLIGYTGLLKQETNALEKRNPGSSSRLNDFVEIIERSTKYCHHLAENWRKVSRDTDSFESVDLVDLAKEVHRVIFFSNPAIEFVGADVLTVKDSRLDLARVFQNLFWNALEAGAENLNVTFKSLSMVAHVEVEDDGEGMDEAIRQKALKDGFTTKEHGTGLGLSICRHLVGAHGATVEIESAPSSGTVVTIEFPKAE